MKKAPTFKLVCAIVAVAIVLPGGAVWWLLESPIEDSRIRWAVGIVAVAIGLGVIVAGAAWWLLFEAARALCERRRSKLNKEAQATESEEERREIEDLSAQWSWSERAAQQIFWWPMLTGILERVFFTILIGIWAPGFGIAMVAWIGAKLAAGWNRTGEKKEVTAADRMRTFAGLQASLVSMLIAVFAGLYCRGFDVPGADAVIIQHGLFEDGSDGESR